VNIIFVSIPIGIILVAIAVGAFFWAVRSGQYDDLDSPAYSILMDEDREERQRKQRDSEVDSSGKDSGDNEQQDR